MRYILGIDPGTKCTGYALLKANGLSLERVVKVGVVVAKGRFAKDRLREMCEKLDEAILQLSCSYDITEAAIEFQHIRPRGEKRPNDMMAVQAISGAALSICSLYKVNTIATPIPSEWKGSQSKSRMEARILEECGIPLDGSPHFDGILPSLRNNAIDALGLALWARRGGMTLDRARVLNRNKDGNF